MKILLVEQLKRSPKSYNHFLTRFLTTFSILPTLYVRQLAAITPKKHHITFINERYTILNLVEDYDLVVLHFTTASATIAYNIADQFRKKKIPVVLCGLHASALPDEALSHADSVLLGRGECNWLSLLDDFEKDQLKKIYSPEPYDTKTCHIPPTKVNLPGFIIMGAVEATRGCPYQCHFCPEGNTSFANHFYTRPIDEVIDEIKEIPQKIIMFYDLSLTINSEYTKELFIKMRPLNKHFFCNGNIDVLSKDPELVHLSKKAGCIGWLVGFESFDQTTLDSVGKPTNKVEEYKKTVDLIHSHKMVVIGDFMFGFDNDTVKVFDNTLTLLKKLQIDVADFTILTPFPGTPLFDQLQKQKRILTTDWDQYSMFKPVFQPKQMTSEQLQQGVLSLYQQYYSPKQTAARVLRNITKGFYPFTATLARNLLASFNSMFFTK